ncbi:fibronectin type III-like domain-contianing protein [Streptomyces rishiriensis]|uniref:fibronectin type III-like domain-contianing protein n=1 Tax=Streptomyces rishiriensis TaxID=68264 RepID=UPI0035A22E4E
MRNRRGHRPRPTPALPLEHGLACPDSNSRCADINRQLAFTARSSRSPYGCVAPAPFQAPRPDSGTSRSTRPVRALPPFAKVTLEREEEATVHFDVHTDRLTSPARTAAWSSPVKSCRAPGPPAGSPRTRRVFISPVSSAASVTWQHGVPTVVERG